MKFLKSKNISKWSASDQTLIAYPKDVGQGNRVVMNATGALQIPKGTTSQRPYPLSGVRQPTDANGMIRYNTTTNSLEAYISGAWTTVRGPATATITKQTLGPGNGSDVAFGPLTTTVTAPSGSPYDYPIIVLVENVVQISTTNYTLDFNYLGSGNTYIVFNSFVPLGKYVTIYYGFGN